MPSLDASALTQDFEGMAFLASVLGPSDGSAPEAGAFDPEAVRPGWTVQPSGDAGCELQVFRRVTESA